ncbi:MAG: MmgE/PrpD family protein [Betaproteobacteria bacterium]|jgi:2-methylcitrate dehydratase PrpD|nr:MmgE/PrpD family protein [Betaproteobacteria bacterium]
MIDHSHPLHVQTLGPVVPAAVQLAHFSANLRLQDIPHDVLHRAKSCIMDTVACGVFGAQFAWSQAVADYAKRYASGGPCSFFSNSQERLQAPLAALANGAAVHAFEQDSLRFPGAGVHPGAALVPTIAAACQDVGANGATALCAFVAGCEVLFRIGAASHHSSEKLGFHAPGLTGVYGAAVAASVVYGLDSDLIANALGAAGSMSAGLLAFSKSTQGTMVKRLHMGRACEAGILAARLAQSGFGGPHTVLDGRFGYLEVFCRDGDASLLVQGLGTQWETRRICLKRYACHVTAQAPLQAMGQLMSVHKLDSQDVAYVELQCNEKLCSHHDIRAPQDVMQAQYSVPFCLALGLYRDPLSPASFDESALQDQDILQACRAVRLIAVSDLPSSWSARLTLVLKDGRRLECEANTFKGMPSDELSQQEERDRFNVLCASLGSSATQSLYESISTLEDQHRFPHAVSPR